MALGFERERETRYIVAELGMTGLLLFPSARPRFPQHVHVRMTFSGAVESELRYWNPRRFGRLSMLDRQGLKQYLGRRFGCDPLTVSWEEFREIVRARSGRLKPLLMDQQVIADNLYISANEILFRARLHPNARASRLPIEKIEQLFQVTREVLQEAIRCGGSSVRDFFAPDGREGEFKRRHLVYGKDGALCPNGCGRTIKRLMSERSSFFCPSCQSRTRMRRSRGRARQGVSLGEPRDYTQLGVSFYSWVVPRPFDPCPLSTSGVLSHLRGFATIRLPLQRFPLLQGAMPWPRCWKVPGWD